MISPGQVTSLIGAHAPAPEDPIQITVIILAKAIGWPIGETARFLKSRGILQRRSRHFLGQRNRGFFTTLPELREKAPAIARFFESRNPVNDSNHALREERRRPRLSRRGPDYLKDFHND